MYVYVLVVVVYARVCALFRACAFRLRNSWIEEGLCMSVYLLCLFVCVCARPHDDARVCLLMAVD